MGLLPVWSVAPLVKLPKCTQFEEADTVMLIMWLLAGSAHLYIWSGLPDVGRSLKPRDTDSIVLPARPVAISAGGGVDSIAELLE
jgi:hypothetical protein